MPKSLPALNSLLLRPPISPEHHGYFENAAGHPFAAAADKPSLLNAWWLAECSLAAYADGEMAAAIFQRGRLRIAEDIVVTGSRHGGHCYVLVDDDKIILAFRGTQTFRKNHLSDADAFREQMGRVLRDISTDAKTRRVPWQGRSGGTVHRGFADSLHELLPAIREQLGKLRAEKPQRRLWLTGHSLGAALATLAADCLDDVQGIHVFGSPQVGDAEFAGNLKFKGWRFRHHADIVSWLPTRLLGYRHVEPGAYFDRSGTLGDEPDKAGLITDWWKGIPGNAADAWAALREGSFAGIAPESINDHAPLNYAVLTWNAYETELNRPKP